MRCKICKKVVRTANKPSRTRLVCGICLKSTKKLLKTIPMVINNGKYAGLTGAITVIITIICQMMHVPNY